MAEPQEHRQGRAPAPNLGESGERRARLLSMRVSRILDANEAALEALIAGGFGPLANPVARLAMAHTVNLQQAFRIRGQPTAEQEALIARLLELRVDLAADEGDEPEDDGRAG